ncbi:hypothetical protein M413DRAFT_25561 [Hebeloma cylindrosporum]|uniref:Uncharacterized protein n=1 Tax=Hebeloma cylindrosporum TaxID=76867 RepID=A0A0C2YSW4_HEBCY|nr:hypothetical protein M413DRAFT_25561 [Hebeloma cylindrosporum h7]
MSSVHPQRGLIVRTVSNIIHALVAAVGRLDKSLSPAVTIQRLRAHKFTVGDSIYLFHIALAAFWITLMQDPAYPNKLAIPIIALLIPFASQAVASFIHRRWKDWAVAAMGMGEGAQDLPPVVFIDVKENPASRSLARGRKDISFLGWRLLPTYPLEERMRLLARVHPFSMARMRVKTRRHHVDKIALSSSPRLNVPPSYSLQQTASTMSALCPLALTLRGCDLRYRSKSVAATYGTVARAWRSVGSIEMDYDGDESMGAAQSTIMRTGNHRQPTTTSTQLTFVRKNDEDLAFRREIEKFPRGVACEDGGG